MSRTESPAEIADRLRAEREGAPLPPAGHRLAITGGRDHVPSRWELAAFWRLFDRLRGIELHHGDARGVDRYVAAVARGERPGLPVIAHPAEWRPGGVVDKAAGIKRNLLMLARVEGLIVFPGGRGTEHCHRAALARGIPCAVIAEEVQRHGEELERELIDPALWG